MKLTRSRTEKRDRIREKLKIFNYNCGETQYQSSVISSYGKILIKQFASRRRERDALIDFLKHPVRRKMILVETNVWLTGENSQYTCSYSEIYIYENKNINI